MNQRKRLLKTEIKKSMVNRFQQICDFREIQDLDQVVDDDEDIIQAVNGWIPHNNNGTGLIILTNKRIVFFNHRLLFSSDSSSIPLSKINSVTPHRHMIYGYIDFDNGAQTFTASHIFSWKCYKFVKAVDLQITEYEHKVAKKHNQQDKTSSNSTTTTNDPVKELQELNQMKTNHEINDEDYQAMKHKLLNN